MFLTVHATVAAALTQSVPTPWIAFVLGFFSHFVLDAIPHGDEIIGSAPTKKGRLIRLLSAATIDGLILSVILFFGFSRDWFLYPLSVTVAAIGAMLPDALQLLADLMPHSVPLQRFRAFHHMFHHGLPESLPFLRYRPHMIVGVVFQIITLSIALKMF